MSTHVRNLRSVLLGVALAALLGSCSGNNTDAPMTSTTNAVLVTTTTTSTTTTAPSPTTTTTPETTTTTPETTTTSLLEADPEEVAIIEAQAHDVIMDFLTRISKVGTAGWEPLREEGERFEGPFVSAMVSTSVLHSFALRCVESGICQSSPAEPYQGHVKALAPAGTEVILPYGDGTYYVSGVYSVARVHTFGVSYIGGFKFRVEGGKAILMDAVGWPLSTMAGLTNTENRGIWLSDWYFSGSAASSRVKVTSHNPDVVFGPAVALTSIGAERSTGFFVSLPVTNNSNVAVAPFGGAGTALSFARGVVPGETQTSIFRANINLGHLGTDYTFDINYWETDEKLATVTVSVPTLQYCFSTDNPEPETIKPGDCIRPTAIARARGFAGHEN